MSAPLRSHGRDPRLQGVINGISYNQQESGQAAADDSSARSDRNGRDGSERDSDLETPHDIFAEEEEESTTHNATDGTHNAVNQRNVRSTTAAAATACSRHRNGNANMEQVGQILLT